MAQFVVYTLPDIHDMIFVDLQSGTVDEFNTRLVAPLVILEAGIKPFRKVNRELVFDTKTYLFMPQLMSAVRTRDLGEALGNIGDQLDRIVSALDVLFVGI